MLLKTQARKSDGVWTAAKMAGCIFMAPIGLAISILYIASAEDFELRGSGVFWVGTTILASYVGWNFLGKKPGFGYSKSIIRGFAAGVYVIVGAVIWQAIIITYQTIDASSFDSPEVIPGVLMESIIRYGYDFLQPGILIVGMIGGTIVGRVVGSINWHFQ